MGIELTAVDDVVPVLSPLSINRASAPELPFKVAAVDDEGGVAGPYGSTMTIA